MSKAIRLTLEQVKEALIQWLSGPAGQIFLLERGLRPQDVNKIKSIEPEYSWTDTPAMGDSQYLSGFKVVLKDD